MTDMQPSASAGWRQRLDVLATVLVILTCGALLWRQFGGTPSLPPRAPEAPLPAGPISIEGAALMGDSSAPAVMLVFSEFECPYCASFATDTLPSLLENYVEPGRLLVAYQHFPLEQIHVNAVGAAKAAECASRVGHFWHMHDALFLEPRPLVPTRFEVLAEGIGLGVHSFRECMAGDVESKVRAHMAEGRRLGVSGTPTFFFGRRTPDGSVTVVSRFTGARPATEFRAAIDALLVAE